MKGRITELHKALFPKKFIYRVMGKAIMHLDQNAAKRAFCIQ